MEIVNIELIIKSYPQMLSSAIKPIRILLFHGLILKIYLLLFVDRQPGPGVAVMKNPGEFFSFTPTQLTLIIVV